MLALIIVAIAAVVLAAAYCAAVLLLARAVVFPQRARPTKSSRSALTGTWNSPATR